MNAGLGIAMLFKHTVMEELKTGRLVSLNLNVLPLQRHWHLIQPLNIPGAPAAKTIWGEICEMEGSFLPRQIRGRGLPACQAEASTSAFDVARAAPLLSPNPFNARATARQF